MGLSSQPTGKRDLAVGPHLCPFSLQDTAVGRRQETLTPAGRRPGEEVKFE